LGCGLRIPLLGGVAQLGKLMGVTLLSKMRA